MFYKSKYSLLSVQTLMVWSDYIVNYLIVKVNISVPPLPPTVPNQKNVCSHVLQEKKLMNNTDKTSNDLNTKHIYFDALSSKLNTNSDATIM